MNFFSFRAAPHTGTERRRGSAQRQKAGICGRERARKAGQADGSGA